MANVRIDDNNAFAAIRSKLKLGSIFGKRSGRELAVSFFASSNRQIKYHKLKENLKNGLGKDKRPYFRSFMHKFFDTDDTQ